MATNPLYRNLGVPVKPKPRPKTPAEIAAEMLASQKPSVDTAKPMTTGQIAASSASPASSSWQAPKPNMAQAVSKPTGSGAPSGANSWLDYHEIQAQNGTLPQGATVVGPGGQVSTVGGSVSPAQQVGGIVGPIATGYAVNQGVNALLGDGMAATTPSTLAGSAPSTPSLLGATSTASPSLPTFNLGYGPENYLSDSFQLPGQIGAEAPGYTAAQLGSVSGSSPWWAAPGGSDAAALGSNIGSGLEFAGVGAETAGTIGSGLGTAIPVAGGLYGAYNLGQNLLDDKKDPMGGAMSGMATGAAIGSFIPGVGTLIGGGVGALAGGALGMIGSGKGEDQVARDEIRGALKDAGVLDDNFDLTLANGSKFDIGDDGSVQNYNVDFEKEGAGDVVAAANPLAAIVTGGNPKLKSDFAGYFANAAMSAGDSTENIKKLYADAGLDHATAYKNIQDMVAAEKLSKEEGDAYLNGLDQLFGVGAYGSGKKESSGGGGKKKEKKETAQPVVPTPITSAPAPVYGEPSGTQPVSVQDYVNAIIAVNQSNQSENQGEQIIKLMKMKNPLFGSIV